MYDLCVIGCGAAGMSGAIAAAGAGKSVIIVDRNDKPGKKIYSTGNGKCNITNRDMNYKRCYNSNNAFYDDFLLKAFGGNADARVDEFLNSLGIVTYTNSRGYVYPASEQASAVVWAYLDRLRMLGVKIQNKTEIISIDKYDGCFVIKSLNGEIRARELMLCCGGNSYKKLGGTKLGFELAKLLGHRVFDIRPALCGVITKEKLSSLFGVRVRARAALVDGKGNVLSDESGELQITDYGLSGIMIFNLSSRIGDMLSKGEVPKVRLELIDEITRRRLLEIYSCCSEERTVIGALNGAINDKLCEYVVNCLGYDRRAKLSEIDIKDFIKILDLLGEMSFEIVGLRDFDNAQLTAGGVDISEIDPDTFMSKLCDGLYFAGEMIDIDGICGGYNLTFAILSGIKAGRGHL